MSETSLADLSSRLDDLIESYEAARAAGDSGALVRHLPSAEDPHYEALTAELIRVDMEWSWRHGERRGLADYESALPRALVAPEFRSAVAYEEYRLRQGAGEQVDASELGSQYGVDSANWPQCAATSSDIGGVSAGGCDEAWEADSEESAGGRILVPGEAFAGFVLERRLGSGAFAEVFLARQGDLSDRRVVLKITAVRSLEPQHLARLQHTNIVPIYSVHREGELTAVCMPYLGDRTLEDLFAAMRERSPEASTGEGGGQRGSESAMSTFLAAGMETLGAGAVVDASASQAPGERSPLAAHSPLPWQDRSRVDISVWIASQIVNGLAHAHARGIVHRDIKPANILIGDDGTPMLLDFNLSEDLVVHGRKGLLVGGTLPYMSPEHLDAIARGGQLDGRADLYAVGVLLFELLTGERPFPLRRGPFGETVAQMARDRRGRIPSVRDFDGGIPYGVAGIVHRCLAADPARRYVTAVELAEDLQRHLRDEPLLHAPDLVPRERIGKWLRRHPRIASGGSVAAVAAVGLAAVAGLWSARGVEVARLQAEQTYVSFASHQPSLLMSLGSPEGDSQLLAASICETRDELSPYGILSDSDWDQRDAYCYLPAEQREALHHQLSAVLYLLVRNIDLSRPERISEALQWNQRALDLYDADRVPGALLRQRAELLAGSDPSAAEALRQRASKAVSDGAIDQFEEIYLLHSRREFGEMLPRLAAFRDRQPTDPVPWFLMGSALVGRGDLLRAETHLSMAVALAPESPTARYLRGRCRFDLRDYPGALEDFHRAVELRPEAASHYLNRALVYESLGRDREAESDLSRAIELAAVETRVYFLRSRVRQRLGDLTGAEVDFQLGLELPPADELSWIARGMARLEGDPEAALGDFRSALALNPKSISALRNVAHVLGDRLGRPEEAREVLDAILAENPRDAGALAGRAVVSARQGDRPAALADVGELLRISADSQSLFQAACVLSITSKEHPGDLERAMAMLMRAVAADARWHERSRTDPDLANLRSFPAFQRWGEEQ